MKKLKLHKQETNFSCSVACLRMILDFYGVKENEKTLRKKSKTKPYGTHPLNIVECAKSYNFQASLSSLNFQRLKEFLEEKTPIITNILKQQEEDFYIHSVVVFQVSNEQIHCLDPEDGEIKMKISLFESLWESTNFTAIIIQDKIPK